METTSKCFYYDLIALLKDGIIKAKISKVLCTKGADAWLGQSNHPTDILRHNEMPSWTQHVRPKDFSGIKGCINLGLGHNA
jgi:hypothetical protein